MTDFDLDAPCRPSRIRGSRTIVGYALLAWAMLISAGVAGLYMAEDLLQHV